MCFFSDWAADNGFDNIHRIGFREQ